MRQSVCHVVAQTMLISHNRTPCLLASSARQHTPLSGGKANFVRHSTAHTAAAAALHAEAAAVTAWRQALLSRAPSIVVQARGVTFHDRQAVVPHLVAREAVVLAREPSNAADPNAVAIYTADMRELGYVGRQQLSHTPMPVCFGHVASAGPVHGGPCRPWGVSITVKPTVHGLWLDFLPPEWQAEQQLKQVISGDAWADAQQQVLQQYGNRCAISGTPAEQLEQPLQVVPQWGFDLIKQRVYLSELLPVCQSYVALKQQLDATAERMLQVPEVQVALERKAARHANRVADVQAQKIYEECGEAGQAHWEAALLRPGEPVDTTALEKAVTAAEEAVKEQFERWEAQSLDPIAAAPDSQLLDAFQCMTDMEKEPVEQLMVVLGWQLRDALLYMLTATKRRQQVEQEQWQLVMPNTDEDCSVILSHAVAALTNLTRLSVGGRNLSAEGGGAVVDT